MFLKYYGLREQPFGVTPDPRFLYLSPAHREALASLVYGIESGLGFLALIASPGMGKTTLLFHLLEKFRTSARTAFLFQTQCNSREFMRFLLAELATEATAVRIMVDEYLRLHLDEKLSAEQAAMAKWYSTEKQVHLIDRCLQLHGGYGYMREYPIARAYLDARVQTIYGGTTEIMKEIIGRSLGV